MTKKKLALKKTFPFSPDFAVAPGVTLAETLSAKGMPQSELSIRTGLAEKTISQIMNGVAPISFDTALKLEAALGVPASAMGWIAPAAYHVFLSDGFPRLSRQLWRRNLYGTGLS